MARVWFIDLKVSRRITERDTDRERLGEEEAQGMRSGFATILSYLHTYTRNVYISVSMGRTFGPQTKAQVAMRCSRYAR